MERNTRVDHYFEKHLLPLKNVEIDILQIGVYSGDATLWFRDNLPLALITDVDPWVDYQDFEPGLVATAEAVYLERIPPHDLQVGTYKMTSAEFFSSKEAYAQCYDFIYIDGDHRAAAVLDDAAAAWRHLSPRGLIAFDDYEWPEAPADPTQSPRLAIDAFLAVCADKIEVLEIGIQVWIKKKEG